MPAPSNHGRVGGTMADSMTMKKAIANITALAVGWKLYGK
jgi:hypothetical protein